MFDTVSDYFFEINSKEQNHCHGRGELLGKKKLMHNAKCLSESLFQFACLAWTLRMYGSKSGDYRGHFSCHHRDSCVSIATVKKPELQVTDPAEVSLDNNSLCHYLTLWWLQLPSQNIKPQSPKRSGALSGYLRERKTWVARGAALRGH